MRATSSCSSQPSRTSAAHAFLEHARPSYDRILFIGGGGTDLLSRRIGAAAVDDGRVQIQEYGVALERVSGSIRRKDFDYSIYQLLTGPSLHLASRSTSATGTI